MMKQTIAVPTTAPQPARQVVEPAYSFYAYWRLVVVKLAGLRLIAWGA